MTATSDHEPLTPAQLEVLEFARATWGNLGRLEDAVRYRFGYSTTVFHARLGRVLEHPDAAAYDPQLVRRLLDLRDRRRVARTRSFEEAIG